MDKPNDFLAAQLQAPDNFTLADFYAYGITPDNTVLREKDYYKNIPKVIETFDKNGEFDNQAFDQFYDSVLRSYNDWASTDFTRKLIENYSRSPEDISLDRHKNVRDTSAKLYKTNDPWRHQVGFGNIYEVGDPSYDIREVAQANKARDAEGNILDWTPNDKGGLFKGLFRNPMVLATDQNGNYLLDEEGEPFYRELADGESSYGKELLHYSDTLTVEDSWLNKVDFFDNDSLDKSVTGTIARTIVKLAPYFLPGVGEVLGAIGAVYGLARSLPMLAKAINSVITNNSDESDFGKTMNNLEAFWGKFDTSKTRHSMEHQWSLENIGDMVVSSAKQLFEQRTFTRIPEWLKLEPSKVRENFFGTMSLGYMALTSSEDSLETFKNGGMSDISAGIASLAYTAAMFGLMNNDYFKSWLFRNSWVNGTPEISNTIKANSKASANVAMESVKNAVKGNKKLLVLPETASKKEGQKLFKTVFNATKEAWAKKSIDPLKGLDIALPGSINAGNVYIHHALNEGIEEVMEEGALDGLKLMAQGLEVLGFDLTDETKENLDFGLTWGDAIQRYTTAFFGGAIGGAVFQGMDDWHSKVLNKDISRIAGRGVNGELFKAIRTYGKDRVIHELDRLHKKGVLGDKNLKFSGKWTNDPTNEGQKIWVWDAAKDGDKNQNDYTYSLMVNRINTIAAVMADENLNMSDNEILANIVQELKTKAEAEGISEEEYTRKHHFLVFDEFAKKTGFADVILTDVGNLMLDIIQINDAIEARKLDIGQKYPGDTNSAERENAIKKDSVIKNLEKQKDDLHKQLDDIQAGKAASYYVRYANFAAHSTLVSKLMSANGNDVLDKESYSYWKYRTSYTDAGEELKKTIDVDYTEYIKLQGIGALESANTLYQRAVDLVTPLINSQQQALTPANIQSTVLGTLVGDLDTADTSSLLDRDGVINTQNLIEQLANGEINEENLNEIAKNNLVILHNTIDSILSQPIDSNGQPYTDVKKYRDIINIALQAYQQTKESNSVGIGADDWVRYAFRRIGENLLQNSPAIKTSLDRLKNNLPEFHRLRLLEKDLTNDEYADLFLEDPDEEIRNLAEELRNIPYDEYADDESRQEEIRKELYEYADDVVTTFLSGENEDGSKAGNAILSDNGTYERAKTLYDKIVSELATKPEEALKDIDKLSVYLSESGVADKVMKAVTEIFKLDTLRTLANDIKKAVDLSNSLTPSPALDIAKAIAFDLSGEENSIFALIESQRGELSTKAKASEYIIDPNIGRNLEIATKVLPIVESVLWAAANGINDQTNKMLSQEGKGELPIISDDLWYIYKNDLAFIENQINFLNELSGRNLGAKTREQILVRNNFCGHIVDFIMQTTPNNAPIEAVNNLQKALGGFDLVEAITRLGLSTIDYSDQSKENQIKIQEGFRNLEHEIHTYVKNNTDSLKKASRDIMNVFPDSFKMKNGILSRKYEDGLSNFDIATYFIGVIGYDSFEFGRKLKHLFETDEKFPFFGQELAIRLIVAGIANPDIINGAIDGVRDTLDWAIENGKIENDPGPDANPEKERKYLEAKTRLWNTMIIDGFAGTGKSTVVLKTALSFFDNIEVVGVSKIQDRATAMGLDTQHTFDLTALLTQVLGKPYTDKDFLKSDNVTDHSYVWKDKNIKVDFSKVFSEPDKKKVLVIDECTLVKEGIWEALVNAAKEQNVIIIGLGNTMQMGEVNESTGVSAGLDDCFGIISTKLTVSMRDGNLAKAANNDFVGRVVDKLISAKKENPNWTEKSIIGKNPTGAIILKYGYDNNNRLFGDRIVSSIDDTTVDGIVNVLSEDETLMVVTPNNTLNGAREKYKTDKRIKFVTSGEVQGSESDYVIINHKLTSDNKFVNLQAFYTLLTRAKKGTLLKLDGLDALLVSDEEDRTAAISTGFNSADQATIEYKETWLAALNTIPTTVNETNPSDVPTDNTEDDSVDDFESGDSESGDGSHGLLPEEVLTAIDQEVDSDTEDDESTTIKDTGVSGDEQVGLHLKGERRKAYKKYRSLKMSGDTALIDIDYFGDFLAAAKITDFGLYSGIPTNIGEDELTAYKNLLRGVSSIVLNHNKNRDGLLLERSNNIGLSVVREFNPAFVEALEQSFIENNNVFFKKEYGDKMMLYYIFDKYAIPVAIYDPGATSESTEGFVTIDFKQETPIIPITSQGQSRNGLQQILSNSVYLAQMHGDPVTAILLEPKVQVDDTKKNKYFLKNIGKAFALLVHEFGMTSEEVQKLFDPEKEGDIITYLMKNDALAYALAGVQEDINATDFINILSDINVLLEGGNLQSQTNIKRIARIAEFFGKDVADVQSDFDWVYNLNKKGNLKENADRYRRIRNEYGLLYTREINAFITALFSHFANQGDDNQWAQFSQNIITNFIGTYKNNTSNDIRRRGFRLSINLDDIDYNWFIVPQISSGNNFEFRVYYTNENTSADPNNIVATFSYNDLIKNEDGKYRLSIQNIVKTLCENDDIKNQILRIIPDFDTNKINDYIRTDTIRFSLTTGIEDDNNIKFYPPFESQVLKLIENTDIKIDELDKFIKASTIFKYGLYRQIKTAKNIDIIDEIWARGKVSSNKLSWDIVKVLAPLYSMETETLEDTEYDVLIRKFDKLFSPIVAKGNLSIVTDGNKLLFKSGNQNSAITNNVKIIKFLGDNGYNIGSDFAIDYILIDENKLTFHIYSGAGSISYTIDNVTDINTVLHDLLDGYENNEKLVYNTLVNEWIEDHYETTSGENVDLVKVNNRYYQLKKNNTRYDYKVIGKVTNGDKIFVYISSKAFDTIQAIEVTKFSHFLSKDTQELLTFLPYDDTGYIYYYINGNVITRVEDSKSIEITPNEITPEGIVLSLENDVKEILRFKDMIPEQVESIKKIFGRESLKFVNGVKAIKKKDSWKFIGDVFVDSAVLRTICDYDDIKQGIVKSIDFKNRKIRINNSDYNLLDTILTGDVKKLFDSIPEHSQLKIAFNNLLKPFASKLSNLSTILKRIDLANDPVSVINSYLQSKMDDLQMSIQVGIAPNGDFEIVQENQLKDYIAQKVLSTGTELKYSDLEITIHDLSGGNYSFNVKVQNADYYNGTVAFVNDNYEIELFLPNDSQMSIDYFKNNIADLYVTVNNSDTVDLEINEYLSLLNATISGKEKFSRYEMRLKAKLIKIGLNLTGDPQNTVEQIAKLYNEWVEFNKNCKI